MGGFSRNFIFEHFSKNLSRRFKVYYVVTRITFTLHEGLSTFMTISLNASYSEKCLDKICVEN